MKKQTRDEPDETPAEKKPAGEVTEEAVTFDEPDEHELQAQKLSEIESIEVAPTSEHEASVDPDKEIVIKKPVVRHQWWKQRKIIIPAGVVLLVVIILAIPFTRFLVLGWAWRENVTLTIVDSSSNTPVTDAAVSLAGKRAITNSLGKVTLTSVPIGYHTLKVEKTNYKTTDTPLTVDVFSASQNRQQAIVATGRPLAIKVVDRLTNKPVADATITDGKTMTFGRTDGEGRATVVIPVNKKELDVSVTAGKYRVLVTKLTLQSATLQLIPDGTLYFLSKQSGKIDVVKSGLDGSDRKVIVAGTGDENDQTTTLLASQDWKYLVLKAKRAPNKPESLFLIDTSNDSMKLLDEGNVNFSLIGWSGHRFIYHTARSESQYWRPKLTAIKSYDAEKGISVTLDENASDPASNNIAALYEIFGSYYILDNALVYTKYWVDIGSMTESMHQGKQSIIVSIRPDGTNRKTVKSFNVANVSAIGSRLYTPQEVYYQINDRSSPTKFTYGEYEGGSYKDAKQVDFGKVYPTFLMSPSGNGSFWYEERDGKNALFVGDKNAGGKQELVAKSELKPYGWLTDDYLLLQKKDSELYITTKEQLKAGAEPLKIGDYHKVRASIEGYGYGYGGL